MVSRFSIPGFSISSVYLCFFKVHSFIEMVETVCAKFVSKKIRKVRWQRPAAFGRPNPEYFVAGSWDDEVSYIYAITIYF